MRHLLRRRFGCWCLVVIVMLHGQWVSATQQCTLYYGAGGTPYSTAELAGQSLMPVANPSCSGFCDVGYQLQGSCTTSPGNFACTYQYQHVYTGTDVDYCSNPDYHCGQRTGQVFGTSGQGNCLPNSTCTGKAGQEAFVGGNSPASGNVCDSTGCEVATTQPTMTIYASGSQSGPTVYASTYTGNSCQAGTAGVQVSAQPQCVSIGGSTVCADQPGKNCGTFNGDEVCVSSVPAGTCVSYASGGVACTASSGSTSVATPPGPNNGTAGQPATPTGQVVTGSGAGQQTTNYYSSATVAASTAGVQTTPGGPNVGNGGTAGLGSSSGGGSGSGTPNAANGDCGASGVDCSDVGLPTLGDEPTMAESAQTYYGSLSAVPIVAAVSNIAAAVPTGQCPTATFSVYGSTYTIDEQCSLWQSVQSIVQVCMLAVFTILGVRILMSA